MNPWDECVSREAYDARAFLGRPTSVETALSFTVVLSFFFAVTRHSAAAQSTAIKCVSEVRA